LLFGFAKGFAVLPQLEFADMPADAIEVGRIADAWGIKGWFKVLPHSASPEALFFFQALVSAAFRSRSCRCKTANCQAAFEGC